MIRCFLKYEYFAVDALVIKDIKFSKATLKEGINAIPVGETKEIVHIIELSV